MKKGWILTDLECPSCGSPLLRKDNKYYCAVCDREVLVVDSFEEYMEALEGQVRTSLKLKLINEIKKIVEVEDLDDDSLERLEKLIRILNMTTNPQRKSGG